MAYKIAKKQPPQRKKALLEREPKKDEDGKVTGPAPYDTAAPGLYPGEALIELDNEQFVAVSVDPEWVEGYGVTLRGYARWCEADGTTHLCPAGKHVEITYTLTVDNAAVQQHGLTTFKKEVLLLMLGEEPEAHLDDVDEDNKPTKFPLVMVNDHDRLLVNVRHHIKCVEDIASDEGALTLLS